MLRRALINKLKKKVILIILIVMFSGFMSHTTLALEYPNPNDYVLPTIRDVEIIKIQKGRLNGLYYKPKKVNYKGLVVIPTGYYGSVETSIAENLSWRGYNVIVLCYFNNKNLPKLPNLAPVDVMDDLFVYCKENNIDCKEISLLGINLGSAFAQIAANNYPEVKNIILYSPMTYLLPFNENYKIVSQLSFRGKEIPYLNPTWIDPKILNKMKDDIENNKPLALVDFYEMCINNKQDDLKALDLSNFKGNILIFAGEDDQTSPSKRMGEEICSNFHGNCEIHVFKDAGNLIRGNVMNAYYIYGGTKAGNKGAYTESNTILLEFLDKNMKLE